MTDAPIWTGWIRRDGAGVVGEITDTWGWKIYLTGMPGEHDGKPCFVLEATVGVPPALRVAGVDE